jgi:hypothetical protein
MLLRFRIKGAELRRKGKLNGGRLEEGFSKRFSGQEGPNPFRSVPFR